MSYLTAYTYQASLWVVAHPIESGLILIAVIWLMAGYVIRSAWGAQTQIKRGW